MRKRRDYTAGLRETHPGGEPVTAPLEEMFDFE